MVYRESHTKSFIRKAREYVNREGEEAPFTSFELRYPWVLWSQDDMDIQQESYYLYWRKQLEAGFYLQTSLGYLFFHIFEILNMIGFDDPQLACDRLINLWQRYRDLTVQKDEYPSYIYWIRWTPHEETYKVHPLDYYLVEWIADFLVLHKLSLTPTEWYKKLFPKG